MGRINRDEGQGSKSEKLADALENSKPIIIVTIQTFPWVLKAIENSLTLKERSYAIIADEAHSSQTGATARQFKEVLMTEAQDEDEDKNLSADDMIAAVVAARRVSPNLSYFAFTATPKTKTLELFGRVENPEEPPSKRNKPKAFHVYSMRQAIEEGFILDVLKITPTINPPTASPSRLRSPTRKLIVAKPASSSTNGCASTTITSRAKLK